MCPTQLEDAPLGKQPPSKLTLALTELLVERIGEDLIRTDGEEDEDDDEEKSKKEEKNAENEDASAATGMLSFIVMIL